MTLEELKEMIHRKIIKHKKLSHKGSLLYETWIKICTELDLYEKFEKWLEEVK